MRLKSHDGAVIAVHFFIAKCEKELFANCFNQHHRMLIYVSLESVFIYLFI